MNWPIIFLVWILVAVVSIGLYMLLVHLLRLKKEKKYFAKMISDLTDFRDELLKETKRKVVCFECGSAIAPDEEPYCTPCFERLERDGFFDDGYEQPI